MAEEKTDWLVPAAVILGGAGIAAGLYFYMKKPPGLDQGGVAGARLTFDYRGAGGDYILLIRFGYHRLSGLIDWFDPEEGMDRYTLTVSLPGPDSYEFDIDCQIPNSAPTRSYDAEASILTTSMQPGLDWMLRIFKDKAINVRKD